MLAFLPALSLRLRRRRWEPLLLVPILMAALIGRLDRSAAHPMPPATPTGVAAWGWVASAPDATPWGSSASLSVDSLRLELPHASAADRRWRGSRVQLSTRGSLPAYGTSLAVRGTLRAGGGPRNFGTTGEASWLQATGSQAILRADSIRRGPRSRGPAWRRELLEPLRIRLAAATDAVLAPREAGLLKALAVGRRDGVAPEVAAAWAAVGVTHILSISGMHVAMVAGAVLVLVGPPHRRRGMLFLLAAVWGYAALGGLGPTVLRASFMATWAAVATYLGRQRRPLLGLGITVLVLLLHTPARRHDLGLQLSCLATAGLLLASPVLARVAIVLADRKRAGRALGWTLTAVGVGLAAQAATLPLQVARFGSLSWASPAANLILVPVTDLALAIGLVAAPLQLVAPPLGRPLLLTSGALLHAAVRLPIAVTARIGTCLYPRVDAVTVGVATGFALATFAALLAAGAGRTRIARAAVGLAGLAAVTLALCAARPAASSWRFEALDVGQGDALVLTVGRQVWVVDCGDVAPQDCGIRVLVPHLRRLGVHRLRGLVLTHAHADHCGGAASLLRALPADTLYVSEPAAAESLLVRLMAAFPVQPTRRLAAGESLALSPAYVATVLWPPRGAALASDGNAHSLVLWAHGGGFPELLLMGDLEQEEEAMLVARWVAELQEARAAPRLLKVGHHGSSTSSSAPFLAGTNCELAVISVGARNRFRHPSARTLQSLALHDVRVLRTDRGGAVRLLLRGANLWCERPGAAPSLVALGAVDGPGAPSLESRRGSPPHLLHSASITPVEAP